MNIIIFDVWSDFGQYKKFYTTSSPLTFSVPPITALNGLIGALLGWPKKDNRYISEANEASLKFAIEIRSEIKKTRLGLNLIETKSAGRMFNEIKERTQVKSEFLYQPKYRILLSSSVAEALERLKSMLSKHQSVYTPFIGITECIAEFKYIGEAEVKLCSKDEYIELSSVVPASAVAKIKFEEEKRYFRETLPIDMNTNRKVTHYEEIYFEASGKPITALPKSKIFTVDGKNYVFVN